MLDDLAPLLTEPKAVDLLKRIENKRPDQALSGELELGLLWGLKQLGEVEVEPEWFGTDRRPDAYSELLFSRQPAIVEIAAISDAGLAQEEDMRGIGSRISEAVNKVRPGQGRHLYFYFGEESGFTAKKYFRRRKIDLAFVVSPELADHLAMWVNSGFPGRLRIQEGATSLVVERRHEKQSLHFNFFCSMPALAHSLTKNPLFVALEEKARQLRSSNFDGIRCVLLADAGSRLLRHLTDRRPTNLTFSGQEIIEHYLARPRCKLDVVAVFSPKRPANPFAHVPRELKWRVSAFVRPGATATDEGLIRLGALLPPPQFEGYQARSLQQRAAFAASARGWYTAPLIRDDRKKMSVSISIRALLDLFAGRITHEQFNHWMGLDKPNSPNIFKLRLDKGDVIAGVAIESGGIDEDDDRLTFEFARDPAASRLRIGKRHPDE